MSIKDITDYVRQTPGNTNPSVIRSMIEREIGDSSEDVVKYVPQSLTQEQKEQARKNIGAMSADVDIPSIEGLATEDYVNEQVEAAKSVIVTVNNETGKATMTGTEIVKAVLNGRHVVFCQNALFLPLFGAEGDGAVFSSAVITGEDSGIATVEIDADGNIHQVIDILASTQYVDSAIKAIPTPDVSGQINTHNTSTSAHSDIREAIAANTSAIELLTNGASAEEVDSVNDLIQYVKDHGGEVTGMKADIKANADAIDGILGKTEEGYNTTYKSFRDVEDEIDTLYSDIIFGETDSVASAYNTEAKGVVPAINEIHDEIDGLQNELDGKVDAREGFTLVSPVDREKLNMMFPVEASEINGNILIGSEEVVVYTHPDKHAIADVDGLQDALEAINLPVSGGIPTVDFGELTASEDGSGCYSIVDAELFQDYPCFLGKMSMSQENGTTSSMYLLFTRVDAIFWTGYTRMTPNFDSMEIVGTIMVQGASAVLSLTATSMA